MEEKSNSNNIGSAAQASANAAGAALSAGKALGKAAAGNYLGAAAEVVKNGQLLQIVCATVIVLILLVVSVLSAIPSVIFGPSQKWVEDTSAYYDASVHGSYADAVNNIPEFSRKYEGNFLASMLSGIKGTFRSIFGGENDQQFSYSEDAYSVATQESAAKKTLNEQLDKITELYQDRNDQYRALHASILSYFRENMPEDAPACDVFEVTGSFISPQFTKAHAVMIESAYSVQIGNSTDEIDESSLFSWVGYYKKNNYTDTYSVKGVPFSTIEWQGDYLPQYLYEQRKQEKALGLRESEDYENLASSFLNEIYFVNKNGGIITDYSTRTEVVETAVIDTNTGKPVIDASTGKAVTETTTISVTTMTINMYASLLGPEDISKNKIGFWEGPFADDAAEITPLRCMTWTSGTQAFRRQSDFQHEFFMDLQKYTCEFLGVIGTMPVSHLGYSSIYSSKLANMSELYETADAAGIDTATRLTLDGATALKASGYDFVGRYVGSQSNPKNMTSEEVRILSDAGMKILSFYEQWGAECMGIEGNPYNGGTPSYDRAIQYAKRQSRQAIEEAKKIGMPAGSVIYFTVDYMSASYEWIIQAHFEEVARAFSEDGTYKLGMYASDPVINYMIENSPNTCAAYCQCVGGSNGRINSNAAVYQATSTTNVCGISVDIEFALDMEQAGMWSLS